MDIKQKLDRILNRINTVLKTDIQKEFSYEYAKGFDHASKLLDISIDLEFGSYVQIETNRHQEIRDFKKTIDYLKKELSDKNAEIIDKKNQIHSLKQEAIVRKFKVKTGNFYKICKAVSIITKKPYPKVMLQLRSVTQFEEVK